MTVGHIARFLIATKPLDPATNRQTADASTGTVVTLGRLGYEGPNADGAARLIGQPKRFAVLMYLMLSQRGGALTRDKVIGTFWPESDSGRARNALRQTISFVRSCLGERALVNVGPQGLAVDSAIDCDAVKFESLLDSRRAEDALQLYRGEFLPGFHIGGAQGFTDWLDARRTGLSQRAAKAAWDLSAQHEESGDSAGAAFWGKRALSLSPFSESEVQRLLRLLDRVGDLAGALRAFNGLQLTLREEFGANPSAETTELAARIKQRLEAEGLNVAALLGTRRAGIDRRGEDRRIASVEFWKGVERRANADRRTDERRSGDDRRALR